MDQLSQQKSRSPNHTDLTSPSEESPVAAIVQDQLREYSRLWWSCDPSFPQLENTYTLHQQAENQDKLNKMVAGFMYELKHIPQDPEARREWQSNLQPGLRAFASSTFQLEPYQLDFIDSSGMPAAIQQFARMAREFDPQISAEDIYQAGRNVMTANLIQLLAGLPVEVTPSIFAYSMLYPYTDNYLDDPAVSNASKFAFSERFKHRLQGDQPLLPNPQEAILDRLIRMIENQWDRASYPRVYESLYAILTAQSHSLRLVVPGASPFELDVLGISFEKGGTSVLADGYLVAGDLPLEQARFLFGFGTFTQLLDDLEDIPIDLQDHRATVFSQTSPYWPLDRLTNQFIHYGRAVLANLGSFQSGSVPMLQSLTTRCMDPILIDTIGLSSKYYNKSYMLQLERHIPYQFSAIRKQREKLSRQNFNLGKLIKTLIA